MLSRDPRRPDSVTAAAEETHQSSHLIRTRRRNVLEGNYMIKTLMMMMIWTMTNTEDAVS
jgi:hypothetical protein